MLQRIQCFWIKQIQWLLEGPVRMGPPWVVDRVEHPYVPVHVECSCCGLIRLQQLLYLFLYFLRKIT